MRRRNKHKTRAAKIVIGKSTGSNDNSHRYPKKERLQLNFEMKAHIRLQITTKGKQIEDTCSNSDKSIRIVPCFFGDSFNLSIDIFSPELSSFTAQHVKCKRKYNKYHISMLFSPAITEIKTNPKKKHPQNKKKERGTLFNAT